MLTNFAKEEAKHTASEIRRMREYLRLTQEEIATKFGISVASWNRYENGRGEIPQKRYDELKKLYDINYKLANEEAKKLKVGMMMSESNTVREQLKNALIYQLRRKNLDNIVFTEMIEQYMSLYDSFNLLNADVVERGVVVFNSQGSKKNDSVTTMAMVSKQMLGILDKLGLNAEAIAREQGAETDV